MLFDYSATRTFNQTLQIDDPGNCAIRGEGSFRDGKIVLPGDYYMIVKTIMGKTTFIKTITGKIPALKGSFNFHLSTKIALLNQELDFDNPNMTAVQYFNEAFPRANIKDQRREVAKVGLKGDLSLKPIHNMSGGEQVRTKLAVLNNTPSNVLILDEPTNHLDVRAKQALKKALIEYPGAIILVSHEQDFASEICNVIFDAKGKF